MTYHEKVEKALDRAQDAAEAVNDAAKNLYEKAQDLTKNAAENIGEPVNEVAKNLNEVAKEQLDKITESLGEANHDGNLLLGVCVGVASILIVYGVCKAVSYFEKPRKWRRQVVSSFI